MQINNIAPIQTASAERLREMIDTIDEHLRMLKRLGIDTDAWSATVNVWKLQCLLDSEASVMQTRQKDFRVELVTSLLLTPDKDELLQAEAEARAVNEAEAQYATQNDEPMGSVSSDYRPPSLPHVSGHHTIVYDPSGMRRRCRHCHKQVLTICSACLTTFQGDK